MIETTYLIQPKIARTVEEIKCKICLPPRFGINFVASQRLSIESLASADFFACEEFRLLSNAIRPFSKGLLRSEFCDTTGRRFCHQH